MHRDVVAILSRDHDTDPIWPGSADEARQEAARAASEGYDIVAAMGGDGVVHHVADGLVGSGTALGIIPAGTTDVFARILGIGTNPRKAAVALAASEGARGLHVARLIADTTAGVRIERHAMFAVGVGFDADVIETAERRPHGKLRFGGLYFARTAFSVMGSHYRRRPANLRVETEGHRADAVAVMVQIHSRYTYLGMRSLRISPEPDDDLTVLTIPKADLGTAAAFIPRLALGRTLDGADGSEVWHGVTKLVVEADPPSRLQADGELLGTISSAEITPSSERLLIAQ